MPYNIVEEENLFNEDGSTNPPFKVVDDNNNVIYYAATRSECEEFIINT